MTGFVVLTRGADVRRIPFWFAVDRPKLGGEPRRRCTQARRLHGHDAGRAVAISRYRYPTGGDVNYPGPERAYRVDDHRAGRRTSASSSPPGRAIPHVTFDGAEDHLAGYAGLPIDLNPYRDDLRRDACPVAGAVLPAAGIYDIVFDTRSAGRRRAVHVPLLGERRDAADAARRP